MSPGGSLYPGISFQIRQKKSAKSKIIELVMEGVLKTFWKHHKSKEHAFLPRYRCPKKISTFFCHWENRFWKYFWISKWDFLINHKGDSLYDSLSHKGIPLWFIRKSHFEIQKYFQTRFSQWQKKMRFFLTSILR